MSQNSALKTSQKNSLVFELTNKLVLNSDLTHIDRRFIEQQVKKYVKVNVFVTKEAFIKLK